MMANPFDYLNAINSNKDIVANSDDPEQAIKDYPAFMVNRGLSYFPDTIMYANELNGLAHLDKDMQYYYLLNSIRPRKRFSKWAKKREDSDLDAVVEYFGYGYKKAQQALSVLSTQQITEIKEKLAKGGRP